MFFSYWQSVALAILARLGLIRSAEWSTYDADDVAAGLQNFLICVEMFLAAVMHAHAFPPRVRCLAGDGQCVCALSAAASAPQQVLAPNSEERPQPCPTPQDYMDPSRPPPGFFKNVKVMFDVRDVMDDVQGQLCAFVHEAISTMLQPTALLFFPLGRGCHRHSATNDGEHL